MRKKILIIDDDGIYCSIIKKILSHDYDLTFTENSQDAIELINKSVLHDLIIADLRMPGVEGLEFIKLLILSLKRKKTPLFVISGMDDEKLKTVIINMGVDKYFVKPIERFYLKEQIDSMF